MTYDQLQATMDRKLRELLDDMFDHPTKHGLDETTEGGRTFDVDRGLMVQNIGVDWMEN